MSKIYIDSITGRRVSKDYACANPTTTQSRTVKPRSEISKLLTKLRKAIAGLMYLSESEYPFEVFKGKKAGRVSAKELLKQIGKPDAKIQTRSADIFFVNQINNAESADIAAQWINLSKLLTENLQDLALFAVGEIQVDLYFVGFSKDGVLCGVSTVSIET